MEINMTKAKAKPKSKSKSKPGTKRWTADKLLKLAPARPREESRDETLARIRSMLTVPDTPKRKARRA
jgi:hypothetical protein